MNALPFDRNARYAKREYVERKLAGKIARNAAVPFLDDVRALYAMLRANPGAEALAIILPALGYFISPFDAVPDFIPGAGYIDDAAVIALAIRMLARVRERHRG